MILLSSSASTNEKQLVLSPRQFQMEPPENPLVTMAPSTATSSDDRFTWTWVERSAESNETRTIGILEDILSRCHRDAIRFPKSSHARMNYGVALLNQGRLEEAEEELWAASKLMPRNPLITASLARVRILQGRLTEAEQLYEKLALDNPKEMASFANLAYIALRREDLDKATEILGRAISVDDSAILPRFLMAIVLLKKGNPTEAIRNLRVAAQTEVRLPSLHQALGVAYTIAGNTEKAIKSYKTALSLSPNMKNAVRALSNVLIQRGETESLIELLVPYLSRVPDDVSARERLAEAYLKQGQYASAREHYLTAMQSLSINALGFAKQRAGFMNNIGVCFEYQRDDKQALSWFTRAIETNASFEIIQYHNLAKLYIREGQFGKASKLLEVCEENFPDSDETIELQMLILIKQSKYREAVDLLNSELQRGRSTPRIYAHLGWLLTDINHDLVRGHEILTRGVTLFGWTPELTNNLAYTLLISGRPSEARAVLEGAPPKSKNDHIENDVALTATKGLLYLWEGDLNRGKSLYREAEILAQKSRERHLPEVVKQKMHFELAQYYLRTADIKAAKTEVARGLDVKNGRDFCERELIALRDRCAATSSVD